MIDRRKFLALMSAAAAVPDGLLGNLTPPPAGPTGCPTGHLGEAGPAGIPEELLSDKIAMIRYQRGANWMGGRSHIMVF